MAEATPPPTTSNRKLVFFAPDFADACTVKRTEEFIEHGYLPTVFAFRRERYNRGYRPPWPHVSLGQTSDARYWQRLRALLGALPTLYAHRQRLREASAFYVRNIDLLALALLARLIFNPGVAVTYEVLDIQPIQVSSGLLPALLRASERFLLRGVRLLVLSSPGFYRHYFQAFQRYKGDWLLLENKLPRSVLKDIAPITLTPPAAVPPNRRWTVGYFGLIRGQATFELMTRLAERLGDKVFFEFRGILTTVDEAKFLDTLALHPNMAFGGEYSNPRDLPQMYRGVDFVWALDLENVDSNSRWLLPCRFYEAGLFGVPSLTVQGFEVGELVERLNIGWAFPQPIEDSLVQFFETLTPEDYAARRANLMALPLDTFVAGSDMTAVCAAIGGSALPLAMLTPEPDRRPTGQASSTIPS